jgi:hypothetical protein
MLAICALGCNRGHVLVGKWDGSSPAKYSSGMMGFSYTFRADGTFDSSLKNLDKNIGMTEGGTYVYDDSSGTLTITMGSINGTGTGTSTRRPDKPKKVTWLGPDQFKMTGFPEEGTVFKRSPTPRK